MQMYPSTVPASLRDNLGQEASFELLTMFREAGTVWRDDVLMIATERFERRLSEEIGKLRVDVAEQLALTRNELLKWSFLFWIGQVAATAGLLALMLRAWRP
jgi:hypothetical protein